MKSTCENCSCEFEQKSPYRSKWSKTCSYECSRELANQRTKEAYETKGKVQLIKAQCELCGNEFEHRWHKPQKFCSRVCSNKARSGERHPAFKRTEFYPKCVVCGEPTMHTQRITCPDHRKDWTPRELVTCPCGKPAATLKSKYCSEDCRKEWGKKKAPTRMVTHTCQCCGEDFERPYWYPNKKMFCSIKCSNEQHSRKRARHYQFGDLNLNSTYELRFVACLERLQIAWEPWPDDRFFPYEGHEYRPDFLVAGMAIETKGWDHPDSMQPAARTAWDLPEPLVVVKRDNLDRLERIFNREQFLTSLSSTP